jgi:2,3-dihydroxybiphenyl 1,2-dioxygenase
MEILGIGYLGFETPSPEKWRAFGTEILGFNVGQVPKGVPGTTYLRMDDCDYRLAFHPGPIDRLAYIGWEVPGRDEYRAALARFKEYGVEVTIGDKALCELRGVREVARFQDPAGYSHELFYAPLTSPGSFIPSRPHAAFEAGVKGVGHVVLISPVPLEAIDHLFQEVMGFKFVTHGFAGVATFLNPKRNPRSHCIAYAYIPEKLGIHHFGMPVASLDSLGVTYGLVQKRGDSLQATLGRHTQDPVVSFYHYTPGGFLLETFWEERPWNEAGPISQVNPHDMSIWGHEPLRSGMADTIRHVSEFS